MTRTGTTLALSFALALAPGCRRSRCEDMVPEPVAGSYHGGGSLGEERMLRVTLASSTKQVELSYTNMDGSQIKATYRVSKKRKK